MEELEKSKLEMYIRKSLSEEQEAIASYLSRKQEIFKMQENCTEDSTCKKLETFQSVLDDIISEENIHIGQLQQLLTIFEISDEYEQHGKMEATDTYADVINEVE